MCKFHQDVALDVAANANNSFDPLAFNINALALGVNFDIGTYTPTMPNISGHHIYALASQKGCKAFANSGLVYDPHAFQSYRHDTIGFLRERSAEIMHHHKINQDILAKIGTGKQAIRFLNTIPDTVYAPFDHVSSDIYQNARDKNMYHALRLAAADYWDDTQTQEILQKYFEFSVAKTFTEAQEKANPVILRAYEALPDIIKEYGDCAKGICTGASIGAVAHIGCIAKFGALPLLGASAGWVANPITTLGLMTGLSIGGIAVWQKLHKKRGSIPSKLEKMTTYGSSLAAFGIALAVHASSTEHTTQTSYFTDENGQQYMIRNQIRCSSFRTDEVITSDTIPFSYPVDGPTKGTTKGINGGINKRINREITPPPPVMR